ncbi:MAG: TssQ family T6SS-associated lipoprotein [Massilia sp.]
MNRTTARVLFVAMAGAAILSGCDTLKPEPAPTPAVHTPAPAATPRAPQTPVVTPPPAPVLSADQIALRDGIELYNKGAYNEAIKRLAGSDISGGSKANQVQALKYTAFSYCVTSRPSLCRAAFEKAFKLDPAFDLLPGEYGHPLWGPVFAKAKKTK